MELTATARKRETEGRPRDPAGVMGGGGEAEIAAMTGPMRTTTASLRVVVQIAA